MITGFHYCKDCPIFNPLPLTKERDGQGIVGFLCNKWGTTLACSLHGAMSKVSPDKPWWRCLTCNIGVEYERL